MIGPLTLEQRHEKILRFYNKKYNKNNKKFTYECRKMVADKRLRIKGRFVTKQQAFIILDLAEDSVYTNEVLQKLLEQHYNVNTQPAGAQIPFNSKMSQIMHYWLSRIHEPIQNLYRPTTEHSDQSCDEESPALTRELIESHFYRLGFKAPRVTDYQSMQTYIMEMMRALHNG